MDANPPDLSDSDRSVILLLLSARNVGWLAWALAFYAKNKDVRRRFVHGRANVAEYSIRSLPYDLSTEALAKVDKS